MANKIQVRRGTKPYLPTLSAGEFGLAQDTEELFIGGPNGNIQTARQKDLDQTNEQLAQNANKIVSISIKEYESFATKDVDGNVIDWQPAIQEALINNPKKIISLHKDVEIDSKITITDDNTTLDLNGYQIQTTSTFADTEMVLIQANHINIKDGWLRGYDGNNYKGIYVQGLSTGSFGRAKLQNLFFSNFGQNGIRIDYGDYCLVESCLFTNCHNSTTSDGSGNVRFNNCTHSIMTNVFAWDSYGKAFAMNKSNNCTITNFTSKNLTTNVTDGSAGGHGFYLDDCEYCLISTGNIEGMSVHGGKLSRGSNFNRVNDINITVNTSGMDGVRIQGGSDNVVSNVEIKFDNNVATGNPFWIQPHEITSDLADRNKLINCRAEQTAKSGIIVNFETITIDSVEIRPQYNKIVDCEFKNCGYGVYTRYADYTTVKNCVIEGAVFQNVYGRYSTGLIVENCTLKNDGTNYPHGGVNLDDTIDAYVIGNTIITNVGESIKGVNVSGIVVKNNTLKMTGTLDATYDNNIRLTGTGMALDNLCLLPGKVSIDVALFSIRNLDSSGTDLSA